MRDAVVYGFDEFQKGVDPDFCVARIIRPQQLEPVRVSLDAR
jgi:hypothetical protein